VDRPAERGAGGGPPQDVLDARDDRRRGPEGTYGVASRARSSIEPAAALVAVRLDPNTAPPLALSDALEWLNLTDEPATGFCVEHQARSELIAGLTH
jgi:hypothetical protein